MRFDRIEPTGVGRRRHQADVVAAGESSEVDVPVRREVVLDEMEAGRSRITGPQPFPGGQEVPAGLAFVNGAGEDVAMHIVERQ